MPDVSDTTGSFDIVIVGQSGRLTYEAVLFAASLRQSSPAFGGRLIVAEPQPGPLWTRDPRISDGEARDLLTGRLGAKIQPFDCNDFGEAYPQGNKAEALLTLESDKPFVFFDTDTLVMDDIAAVQFDFDRPSASMAREASWPEPQLYGPGYDAIWRAIFDRFDVPFEPTLDAAQPAEHWERYLYFNAGWFFYRSGPEFGARMIEVMKGLADGTMRELASQSLDPWLDQAALPVVVAGFGGGRPEPQLAELDGSVTYHWRTLPLLYATVNDDRLKWFEDLTRPNWLKKVLKAYEPFRRMVYQGRGARVRALFDRSDLPKKEKAIRNRIRREGLWMR